MYAQHTPADLLPCLVIAAQTDCCTFHADYEIDLHRLDVLVLPSYQLVTAVVHIAMQCYMFCAVHGGVSMHCGRSQHSSLCAGWVVSVQPAGVLQPAPTPICPHNIVHLLYHHCAAD